MFRYDVKSCCLGGLGGRPAGGLVCHCGTLVSDPRKNGRLGRSARNRADAHEFSKSPPAEGKPYSNVMVIAACGRKGRVIAYVVDAQGLRLPGAGVAE